MIADDEQDAFDITAEILSFLPDHTLAEPLVTRGSIHGTGTALAWRSLFPQTLTAHTT